MDLKCAKAIFPGAPYITNTYATNIVTEDFIAMKRDN